LVTTRVSDKPRILVVEDEPIAREILGDLLKMAGYDVLASHSGEQALLTLVQDRGRIDCLFTAVELPGLVDGWMLAEEFRVTDAAMPVVFATRSKAAQARSAEGTAFVARPVLPLKAVEAVNEVTGRAEAALRSRGLSPRIIAEMASIQPADPQPQIEPAVALLKAAS
jgi:two-component system OmpR family response regulator